MLLTFFQLLWCCSSLMLQFVEDDRAKCLDGTQGSYYFQKGSGEGQNKFIVFFEGGELILGNTEEEYLMNAVEKFKYEFNQGCKPNREVHQIELVHLNLMECYPKINKKITISIHGIQSIQIIAMGLVQIIYMLVGFQGYKSDQVNYQQHFLYFRGELIIRSIFDHFMTKFQKAEIIILSGCSIGGVAALQWEQYLTSRVPENIPILFVPDSSILFDMQSIDGNNLLQQSLKIMNYIADDETQVPHSKCAYNYPNQNWKCLYFQNLINFIQRPVFIIQPFYDENFLYNYLDIKCIKDQTLENCQNSEMDFIELVYSKFNQIIKESLIQNSNIGSFVPSCISNCLFISQLSFSRSWTIPEGSNRTAYQTLVKWVEKQKLNQNYQGDFGLIDQVPWPKNSACAVLSLLSQFKLINIMLQVIIIILF